MQLNFPPYNFRLSEQEGRSYIFDIIRKKNILLSPEEWVRQHVIHFLITDKKIAASLIAVERQLEVNKLKKRFDVLVFDKTGKPKILVECKSPDIKLDENTSRQIAIYNSKLMAPYLFITNGLQHYFFRFDKGKKEFEQVNDIFESDFSY